MILYCLNEDKRLEKLPVGFSDEISEKIDEIDWYNRSNTDALIQWHDYLDDIISYISNIVIAWDNMDRFQLYPNNAIRFREFGYDITFMVKTKRGTNRSYLHVFKINLKPEDFGLNIPPYIQENKQHNNNTMKQKQTIRLTESQLHQVINEAVKSVLNEDWPSYEDYGDYSDFGGPFLGDVLYNMNSTAKKVLELWDSRNSDETKDETMKRMKHIEGWCQNLFGECYEVINKIKQMFPNNERIQYLENYYNH